MTFTQKVKLELVKVAKKKECCENALLYGVLLYGKRFSYEGIVLSFESRKIASFVEDLLKKRFSELASEITLDKKAGYMITITTGAPLFASETILKHFYHQKGEVFLTIKQENFTCNDCFSSFLSGAFLSCGIVTDPQKEYHLELKTNKLHLTEDTKKLFANFSLPFKQSKRKEKQFLYLKESEAIEDTLTFMGATSASLELMDTKVYKGLRNKVNRITNCETANITKTVKAATKQIEAIKLIVDYKGWEYFPDDLINIALLRFENPQMSLSEMGELQPEKLSKSAMNNRLMKIMRMAQEVKEEA